MKEKRPEFLLLASFKKSTKTKTCYFTTTALSLMT